MKVLIVSSGLPSKRWPLNGIFAFDQAKALAAHGVDVAFFSIDLRSIRRFRRWGCNSYVIENIRCFEYNFPVGPLGWRVLDYIGRNVVSFLYKKVFGQEQKPDVIHTHFASSLGAFLAEKTGIPLVITEHSSEMNRVDLPQATIDRVKRDYIKASAVIAVSSILASSLMEKTGIECRVIHNIIDVSLFSKNVRRKHSGFTFVTTALLSERKRIDRIILALRQCPAGVRLVIVGDGPMRTELERLVSNNRLGDRVEIKGMLSRADTADVYAGCDCFVLPSSRETFGVVYVEAMAAGLPVIATRCGGPEDFVNDENGVLIDVDNQHQLEDAMNYMIGNIGRYDEDGIKAYVQSKFSPEVVAEQILELYAEILSDNG